MTTVMCCSPSGLKEAPPFLGRTLHILCRKRRRVGMEGMSKISKRKQEVLCTQSMRNAPELPSRLREVGRCMALPVSAADEVRAACRALAETTEAESAEIAAAGLGLAEAAAGDLQDTRFNLRLHLRLQTLTARIQTAAESSQAGRVWAAAQNLAELLVVVGKFLDRAPGPRWAEEFPAALCGLEAVRLEFNNLVSVLGWPTPPGRLGLRKIDQALHSAGQLIPGVVIASGRS